MALNHIVVLVGGVGGAKLAYGLAQVLPPEQLTIIVNTGDDFWLYGLRICPDLDTIMYTLSSVVNKANGWGVADDTANMRDMMQRYGVESWFGLNDKDLATHLLRTQALASGETLTQITARLSSALGVRHRMLPMTDAPVATILDTVEYGEIDFQSYFVRYRWQPTLKGLRYDGIEAPAVTDAVRNAIDKADAIIIGPSNLWLSIEPILSVPGMRDALMARDVPRISVSPVVAGQAVKDPTVKLMVELGYEPSAVTVARYYGDVINGFVHDERDINLQLPALRTAAFDTVMHTDDDKVRLAQHTLKFLEDWMLQ